MIVCQPEAIALMRQLNSRYGAPVTDLRNKWLDLTSFPWNDIMLSRLSTEQFLAVG